MNNIQPKYIRLLTILVILWKIFGIQLNTNANIAPVSERTQQVRDAIVAAIPDVTSSDDVTETQLGTITNLNLRAKGITTLQSGDFSGMTALTNLNLYGNDLIKLSDKIFKGLTALTTLRLGRNAVDPMPLIVLLEGVEQDQFKVVMPTGAPFDVTFPINIVNDGVTSEYTTITIMTGNVESETFTVSSTADTSSTQVVKIGTLPTLPRNHYGYTFARSTLCHRTPSVQRRILNAISGVSDCREVTNEHLAEIQTLNLEYAGLSELRSEDLAGLTSLQTLYLGNNSLTTLPADIFSDLSNLRDLYIYNNNLNTLPADVFSFLSSISQLNLHGNELTTLPKELFSGLHSLTQVFLNDNHLTTLDPDLFSNVPTLKYLYLNNNRLPTLPEGLFSNITSLEQLLLNANRMRSIPEGVFRGISTPNLLWIHNNRLIILPMTISLEKVGSGEFKVVVPSGTPIDINLNITVQNGTLNSASNVITIRAGNIESNTFTITQTGTASDDVTVDFDILSTPPENHLGYNLVKSDDGPLEVISGTNTAPVFIDGETTTRTVAENTAADVNIGTAIAAIDADNDTLTYTLGGIDADDFDIDGSTGQLKTKTSLDYETKKVYTVTISASDADLSDTITVTINVTDINESIANRAPVFTEGETASRSIAENTSTGVNIGAAFAATDLDGNTLTYTLGGTDSESFEIEAATGQLKTKAVLNYESKNSYMLTIKVSDGSLSDSIDVTINITDINEAPEFTEGTDTTRSVVENSNAGVNIGTPISATDPDKDTLTYSLSATAPSHIDIDNATGQLKTKSSLNYESQSVYTITIIVSDDRLSDTINVIINVKDINEAPVFTEGDDTIRTVVEKTLSGVEIGSAVTATDVDGDTLTYILSGADATIFELESTTGQLKTKKTLDFESQSSYKVTVSVSDGKLTDTIEVTITVLDIDENVPNRAPVFTEGESTTRSVASDAETGLNIGTPVAATDVDGNTLKYSLGGTDAALFDIVSTTGQLRTKSPLDIETKPAYSVTITVSDGELSDTINVTINIAIEEITTNRAPVFTAGESTTRAVAENTAAGVNIGTPIAATDADENPLTYSLGGTDAASFDIVGTTGQLQTKSALNYENKKSYAVTVTVTDSELTDVINVTINVSNVNEAPVFTEGESTTRLVAVDTATGVNIGTPIAATDVDGNTLKYSLDGTDAALFDIETAIGQLKTKSPLDIETKPFYSVTITVSDGELSDTINVTINIAIEEITTNRAPVFTEGERTTRSVAENTAAGVNIGTPIAATDADENTLTYTLGGTDAASFDIVGTTGQLQTKSALNYENKKSYAVTVTVTDSDLTDAINVTINISNVNEAPVFTEGEQTSRDVAENTATDIEFGTPVAATDVDSTTLTYSLGGTDSESFDIDSTNGQLKTKAALDYETKDSYTITVTVSDGSLMDMITVAISVTNVDETPANRTPIFTEGTSTTRTIQENTAAETDIGSAISATDADDDDLTYALGGTDAASFDIISTTGQLRTKGELNYEAKSSYSVTVTVSDSSLTDSIDVTINITDVNEAPLFTDGNAAERSILENTASGANIGAPISATDEDNDSLTYTLGGTDASSFGLNTETGQLKTDAALDYENKSSYSVTVSVSDDNNPAVVISVTITVTDRNEAPAITEGDSTTRSVPENTGSGENIGSPISATDGDNDSLEYVLSGTDASSFAIDAETGQLKTSATLDYETKSSYSVTISVTDGKGSTDSISVTINVTNIDESPSTPNFTSVCARTPQVRDEIVKEAGVKSCDQVTAEHLAAITIFNLEDKQITSLKSGDFDGMTGLNTLRLWDNQLTSLPEDIFQPLTSMTRLKLERNQLTTLPEDIFDGLTSLESIWLQANQLTSLPEDIFDGLTALDFITITSNKITSLPEGLFDGLTSLTILSLGSNDIRNIPEDLFDGLSSLVNLSININKISTLHVDVFDGLTSLKSILLGSNDILSISKEHFDGLSSLTYIDLSANELTSLPEDLFEGKSALERLSLQGNKFTTLPEDLFDGLSSLKYLYLQHGELTSLPEDVFDGLTSLSSLGLNSNKLTDLPEDIFDGLSALSRLELQRNEQLNSLPEDIFDGLSSLEDLVMYNTALTSLPADIFDGLSSLTDLELYDTQITSLPDGIFDGLSSLTTLTFAKFRDEILSFTVSLEKVGDNQFKAIMPIGAPFSVVLPVSVTNGNISGDATTVTISTGSVESTPITVTRTAGTTAAVTVDIGTLPDIPTSHNGYILAKSAELPLEVLSAAGSAPTIASNTNHQIPNETSLLSNYPNPFNPETWIPYQLAKPNEVTLTIYNIHGFIVRQLELGLQPAGLYHTRSHAIHWDGRNAFGERVASGVYFYVLKAGDYSATRIMLIRK